MQKYLLFLSTSILSRLIFAPNGQHPIILVADGIFTRIILFAANAKLPISSKDEGRVNKSIDSMMLSNALIPILIRFSFNEIDLIDLLT